MTSPRCGAWRRLSLLSVNKTTHECRKSQTRQAETVVEQTIGCVVDARTCVINRVGRWMCHSAGFVHHQVNRFKERKQMKPHRHNPWMLSKWYVEFGWFSLVDSFISIDNELTGSMSYSGNLFLYHLNWTLHHFFSLSEMFVQEETIFDPSSPKPPMSNMFAFESGYILQTCFGTKNLFSTLSRKETPDKPTLSDRCAHLRAHHVVVISAKSVTHFTSQ